MHGEAGSFLQYIKALDAGAYSRIVHAMNVLQYSV